MKVTIEGKGDQEIVLKPLLNKEIRKLTKLQLEINKKDAAGDEALVYTEYLDEVCMRITGLSQEDYDNLTADSICAVGDVVAEKCHKKLGFGRSSPK